MITTGAFELFTLGLIMPFLYLLKMQVLAMLTALRIILSFIPFIDPNNILLISTLFIFCNFELWSFKAVCLVYGGQLSSRIGVDLGSKATEKF